MKTKKYAHLSVVYPNYQRPYPNAADPQYFTDKLVDALLSTATVLGTVTVICLLITL